MNEDATLNEFVGTESGRTSDSPTGVRLILEEAYPEDWGFAELESVCEVNSGFTWNKEQETDSSEEGAVPVIKIGNVQDGYLDLTDTLYLKGVSDEDLDKNKVRRDWLLMIGSNGSGERVGHCGLIQEDMEFVYASFLYGLRANVEYLLPRYLFYTLNRPSVQQRLTSFTAGSTSLKNLNKSTVENLSLPTPPLSEQRKIATVLYTVDQAVQKTESIVEQTGRLKKGLMQKFYSRGYYDHREWQDVDMQDAYVMTRTSEIPASWDIKYSGDIAEVKTGHTPSTSVDEYWDGEIPWVDIHDLTQLEGTVIRSTDDTITEEGLNNSGAKLLPEGTLVLCRTGAIGETAILGKKMATDQDQVTFECDESEVIPRYLMYLFEYATPQLERLSAGSTHDKVQLHFFSDLEIPLPGIDEQEKIVDVLESVDNVAQANKRQLDSFLRVKQGLMQDLLSGEVRTHNEDIEIVDEVLQYG